MRIAASNVLIVSSRSSGAIIQRLLREMPGCQVVGQAHERHEALRQARTTLPLMAIVEHGSPDFDTVETIKDLKKEVAGLSFLVLLTDETQFWAVLDSKADGYVVWPTTWLTAAVTSIANGGVWLGPLLTEYLLHGQGWGILRSASASLAALPPILGHLSTREREVLNLLVDGMTNQEIANALQLSSGTVKVHVKHILDKMNVNNRAQAVAMLTKIRAGQDA